jgi:hypothetical protein
MTIVMEKNLTVAAVMAAPWTWARRKPELCGFSGN